MPSSSSSSPSSSLWRGSFGGKERESSVSVRAPKLEGQPQPKQCLHIYMSLKRQLIKPYHPQNHVHHHYLAIEEEEFCTKSSWARTTNWENLCAQKLRENLDINTETLKRRKENQWLAHLRYKSYNLRKTYKLWCSLMGGKCYRNIPGAKRCNGKSTTDLKTKIIFAVDENISKGLVIIQWMITRGFVDHWKKWKSAHLISKYCTPLASSIVTACQNI